jgi:hypothetical protein
VPPVASRSAHDALALAALAVVAAGASAWALLGGETRLAGIAVLVAGLAASSASVLADRAGSPKAGFAAEAAERLFDAGSLAPLVWVAYEGGSRVAALALVVLGTGAMAAYVRARGRGLGYRVPLWPAYRAGRGVALAVGLLAIRPEPALWAMLAADVAVGVARWRRVAVAGDAA